MKNTLYYGDNLDVLTRYIPDNSVDLIYLDPPFQSGRDYNILFQEQDGTKASAQIKAFEDTWEWDQEAVKMYDLVVQDGGSVGSALEAFRKLLGPTPMLAYVSMMAPRLIQLRRVLKPTGSIYLHCDSTASAHLRLLMDEVFGAKNFRNEIIWYYYNKMHDRRKKMFPKATDTILFYVKDVNSEFKFEQLKEMRDKPVKQLARRKVDGKMVNVRDEHNKIVYRTKDDKTVDNVWRIPCLQPADKTQRMGYPTQKPEAILERIIEASSQEGDTILDPFCGCGTSISVAQKLRRHWIGIDITHLSIGLIKYRLLHSHKVSAKDDYDVVGEPTTFEGAKQLAIEDRHQFEHWSLGLVGARSSAKDKGADKGIDGKIKFQEGGLGSPHKEILISVKSGKVGSHDIRDLRGVVEREDAAMGLFLTLQDPTRDMRQEALQAGYYESPWGKHLRIQLFTIKDLLDGKKIDAPPIRQGGTTFSLPKRSAPDSKDQGHLF